MIGLQKDNLPLPCDYTVDTENNVQSYKDRIVNASGQLLIDACIAFEYTTMKHQKLYCFL